MKCPDSTILKSCPVNAGGDLHKVLGGPVAIVTTRQNQGRMTNASEIGAHIELCEHA